MKITIIGGGNLGKSLAEGLIESKFSKAKEITVTRRNVNLLNPLKELGVNVTTDNKLAVKGSDLVILAVKPFQSKEVLTEIKSVLTSKHILISVVTGLLIEEIKDVINKTIPLFRAMPNTAIAIRESMTCLCYQQADEKQQAIVTDMFNSVGKVALIDEKLMEAATVLGACGTAYAMRYIRACIQGGIEIGFDANTATLIAAQTTKGAADLLLLKGTHPEHEIDKVTTPKGCTIAGLNEMEHQGFSSSLIKGITVSFKKIER